MNDLPWLNLSCPDNARWQQVHVSRAWITLSGVARIIAWRCGCGGLHTGRVGDLYQLRRLTARGVRVIDLRADAELRDRRRGPFEAPWTASDITDFVDALYLDSGDDLAALLPEHLTSSVRASLRGQAELRGRTEDVMARIKASLRRTGPGGQA